ncbi:hypothetical protein [Arthrobacter sp. GMC3]|uniref:hypothetical protein n=1 Tax=Arthrobacter sp. GMC3 TaxID=2058894 RepID=UPI000CE36F50|nr:hypothetical protein [Arthrobacter sp. GMC3]
MSNYNGAPQPPNNLPVPGTPAPQPGSSNRKTLAIVFGAVAVVVVLGLVALFVWVIPAMTKLAVNAQPAPTATTGQTAQSSPSLEAGADSSPTATSTGVLPAGAVALPPGWDQYKGSSNVPADGDPRFAMFITGESSFQRLASWSYDGTFGLTTDPDTGKEMQQVAQGTEEKDADGISLAFAFFAETDEGKFGTDPATVKAAIQAIQDKLASTPTADLPKNLVGHKCASDFTSSAPETREFRRGLAVVVQFSCKTAAGEDIQAVNLFSVTPWGTPQRMGISGHKSYWDANPGTLELLANSYRINKWKQ